MGRRLHVYRQSGNSVMHWVNTLRGQFVTVVALAVILSSVTVIAILEIARQGELRRVRSGAIIERVANSFELIAELDPQQREAATQAITSNFYHYEILQTDPLQAHVMSDEESTMALSVKASQENQTLALIRVRFPPDMDVRRRGEGGDNGRSRRGNGNNDGDNDRRRSRDRDRDDDDDNRRRSRDRGRR